MASNSPPGRGCCDNSFAASVLVVACRSGSDFIGFGFVIASLLGTRCKPASDSSACEELLCPPSLAPMDEEEDEAGACGSKEPEREKGTGGVPVPLFGSRALVEEVPLGFRASKSCTFSSTFLPCALALLPLPLLSSLSRSSHFEPCRATDPDWGALVGSLPSEQSLRRAVAVHSPAFEATLAPSRGVAAGAGGAGLSRTMAAEWPKHCSLRVAGSPTKAASTCIGTSTHCPSEQEYASPPSLYSPTSDSKQLAICSSKFLLLSSLLASSSPEIVFTSAWNCERRSSNGNLGINQPATICYYPTSSCLLGLRS
mmetsp:Transcript_38381/g.90251  ORF Transcript_38381/g.90251 Transcript_38381/m.90251 type:complete len:313 (-) Transcript_38381:7-945(-)